MDLSRIRHNLEHFKRERDRLNELINEMEYILTLQDQVKKQETEISAFAEVARAQLINRNPDMAHSEEITKTILPNRHETIVYKHDPNAPKRTEFDL